MKKLGVLLFAVSIHLQSFAADSDSIYIYNIKTTVGDILVKLYNDTPKHRDNFVKLADKGYYDGLLFHRVMANFMIQAGDPKSKTATKGVALGSGDVGYTIPAEINYPKYYHKKGVLAAARQGDGVNPKRASSGAQFYLVKGKVLTDGQLSSFERDRERILEMKLFNELIVAQKEDLRKFQLKKNQTKIDSINAAVLQNARLQVRQKGGYKYSPQQRLDYKTIGGAPHLDNEYTVYGEIIEGLNVLDSISTVKTDDNNRPLINIRIVNVKRKVTQQPTMPPTNVM